MGLFLSAADAVPQLTVNRFKVIEEPAGCSLRQERTCTTATDGDVKCQVLEVRRELVTDCISSALLSHVSQQPQAGVLRTSP